ncbi:peroxide stress protein YaaA [Gayadomonas joobiniege]|uniref:peroxide stress protein YaaA n=1 Tax=Gayadomonas joobiniege TaxID=1234606 RepID=UPI0003608A26|nr:peroxide stress protein YaaA [Gayadomonas joobiniege]
MLIVVSPAKNLDYQKSIPTDKHSQPDFIEDSKVLIDICRELTPADVASLMKISDKLAGLNVARFAEWSPKFTPENAKQAMFVFNGDVYTGLDATSLTATQIDYAQDHLRILSGLYGILKPLDLMHAYRLEMGSKLTNSRGKNLYEFWGTKLTDKLNHDLQACDSSILLNLASNEYFKAVKAKSINAAIITPQFKDWKNDQYKMISFYAKKARGLMARYVIENQIKNVNDLKAFDLDGYQYNDDLSSDDKPVFTRKQAD